jgi:ATP-binding cassette, subfamily B, bacterial
MAPRTSSDRDVSHDYRLLFRLARFAKPYGWQIAGATVALIITAGTTLALGIGLRVLVDQGFSAGDASLLDRAVLILFGVSVLLAAGTFARFYLVSWVGERVVADIRKAVFDHIIGLSPGFFEITRTGEVVSRLTTDTTLLQVVVGSSVSIALRNLLLIIGGTVMLFVTSTKLTLVVLAVVPFVVAPIIIFGRKVRRLSRLSQDKVADVSAEASEALYGIRTVQAFAHEPHDRRNFGERTEEAFRTALLRTRWRAVMTGLVILLVFGSISVVFWIGGADVIAGRISPGQLVGFVFYAIALAAALGAVTEVMGDLQRAAGAMERIGELLATRPVVAMPAHPRTLPQPSRGAVNFEAVTFHYPSRPATPALDDFNLSITPGERVAIVGPSGAGKTTVMQLLLRFYDPDAGTIRFDGTDIRDLDPAALRRAIGAVPQDPTIFGASARDNIRYARPDAGDAEVRAAAEAAHALDFLERLPQGLDTYLGERGVRLSGGQRQRIAIARALLMDPIALLMDEAMSALDTESEALVLSALKELRGQIGILLIAHRLATVRYADVIAVLHEGRLVECGTWDELVTRRERLHALIQAQVT